MYAGQPGQDNHRRRQNLVGEGASVSVTTTVAILGGNSVVGRALGYLLQDTHRRTRLIEDPGTGEPAELLEGIQVLVVAPAVSTECRERFLAGMRSTPGTATIPVLTLSAVLKDVLADQMGLVLWPCRPEDLKREIDTALLAASHREQPTNAGY